MEEKKITISGLEVNYKVFAPSFAEASAGTKATEGERGKPILVLHGWGVGSDSWVETAVLLAQSGFRVFVPDMPGFGKSGAPQNPWKVDDYVEWVKDFCQKLGLEKFAIIGHSFGGQIAAKFCARYPQKADKLVLAAAAIIRKPRLGSRQLLAKYLAKTKVIFQNIPFGIYPVLRKIVYKIAGARDYSQLRGVMAQTFLNVVKENVLDSAKKITAPALIVWGDKDTETPLGDAYEIKSAIRGSDLIVIKDCGHKIHRTHNKELAKIIDNFLRNGRG